ncbi:MAG: 1-acyl-sn-glycerol-3-phosphate acyltransferase [Chloroflexi bacterium]|nr:1-acyl-sn-glycerol-3-phosphate acyltransferase [Chloroflexota bacterium]
MRVIRWAIIITLRLLSKVLLKVRVVGMERLPASGPVILAINHINSVDALLLRALLPRDIIAWAKVEIWENPILRVFAQALDSIPLRRGELDLGSARLAIQRLSEGKMLGIAPEGTRSWHGRLQRGRPGLVFLAQHAPQVYVMPVVLYGQEALSHNLRRLRRTPVTVRFGQGFYLDLGEGRVTQELRQGIIDQVMAQIAALLPPAYRGVYSDLAVASESNLRFPPGTTSNLHLALSQASPATTEEIGS